MSKLTTLTRAWLFLYRNERYHLLSLLGPVSVGMYCAIATWLVKRIVNSIASPGPRFIAQIPDPLLLGLVYGILTFVQGYLSSYSSIQLRGVRDRVEWLADELVMKRAAGSADIMAFEISETRDAIRAAVLGGRALPTCFSSSVEVLQYFVTVFGLSIVLGGHHPLVPILILIPSIPLCLWQMKERSRTFGRLLNESPKHRQMQYFVDLVLGAQPAKEIRAYENGPLFLDKYRVTANEVLGRARRQRSRDIVSALMWGSGAAIGLGSSYLYVISLSEHGVLTAGDLVMYSGATLYLGTAVRSLIQAISALWSNILEVESFLTYVEFTPLRPLACPPHALNASSPNETEWVVNCVSFSYPGRVQKALDRISFGVRKNEKIALVGLNGAGKTTLIKVMLRLLDPQEGSVTFRGRELRNWDVEELRTICSVVCQDSAKFRVTLYDSIAMACKEAVRGESEDAVFQAARAVGVDQIASRAPRGYETQLGSEFSGGVELSGGQWQQVALARGIVRGTDVLFLDEPSASLDPNAEHAMFESMLSLVQDKTAIIISHRLAVTSLVDRVLVIEHGRLVEEGTHAKLMERNGKYAGMYRMQAKMYWPQEESLEYQEAKAE
jgi:ATP-binding cassette subfamily B protein